MKRFLILALVAWTSCGQIEQLELAPDIEGIITAFEVEGQTRSQINVATRTVSIEVGEGVDLTHISVTKLTLGPTATCSVGVGDVIDLSAPLQIVITTIASYTWTVSATRTFDLKRALPGGNFDEWNMTGTRTWNPWPEGGVWEQDRWWDTGNGGVALLGPSNSTPTEPGEGSPANPAGRAARLESTWVVFKAAGGNIYFGKFGKFNGLDATCDLGHNWQSKPRGLKGWYKYFPQPIDRVSDAHVAIHPFGLTRDQWMGSPDSLHVCVALWASPDGRDIPFTVDTNISSFVDFSRDADGVLAYGSFVSAQEQASWSEFSVDMEYFTDAPLPSNTQLYLLVTSSKNCNYFIAGTGSVAGTSGSLMYVDELELVYD